MKKITLLVLLLSFCTATCFAKKQTEPLKMEITGTTVSVGEDSVTVTLFTRTPKEMLTRQVLHKIDVFLVSNHDFSNQTYVATLYMRGERRERVDRRMDRRNGIRRQVQSSRKIKTRTVKREVIELPVKVKTQDWMEKNVSVYIRQSHSSRLDIPLHPFDYELYFPEYR